MSAELQHFSGRPVGIGRPAATAHIVGGAVMSLLLHGVLVGLVVFGTMRGEKKIEEEIQPKMLQFEQVELLALGEEKPPNALPRLANPEPPKVKPDEIVLEQPEKPVVKLEKKVEKPEAKEEENADERKKKMLEALSALHNPNRPTNEDIPEGAAEGVVGGTVSDAALANLTATYAQKLNAEISRVWQVSKTIPAGEIGRLSGQVSVYVRLSDKGHVVNYSFRSKSDNDQFNDDIERVLKRFQVAYGGKTLPLPEQPEVREAILRQGINLNSWEYTGR